MKKKIKLIVSIGVLTIISVILIIYFNIRVNPLSTLNTADIKEFSIYIGPGGYDMVSGDEEISELADILHNMKLKNIIKPVTRGFSYLITVSMKNGESHDIYFEGNNIIGIDNKEYTMIQDIEPLVEELYNRLGEKYEYVAG